MESNHHTKLNELERFVQGKGTYTNDIHEKNQGYLHIVRSAYAHANFVIKNLQQIKKLQGILMVISAEDMDESDFLPIEQEITTDKGSSKKIPLRTILPHNKTVYLGEPICAIVGETHQAAQHAIEQIEVDYKPIQAITEVTSALNKKTIIHKSLKTNQAIEVTYGEPEKVKENLKNADHTFELTLQNPRIIVNSLEPRCCLAKYQPNEKKYTLYSPSQGVHAMKAMIQPLLKDQNIKLEVITKDVGGGFGMKISGKYPESILALHAAKHLNRPIKWNNTRSESFISDTAGRDVKTTIKLGISKAGKFQALSIHNQANQGAYAQAMPEGVCFGLSVVASGIYHWETAAINQSTYYTNTTNIGAYRGAWRPESIYIIERIIDMAARGLKKSPIEIRLNNIIKPEEFPYKAPFVSTYDSGDYQTIINKAVKLAQWDSFEQRKIKSRKQGKLRGIGVACYTEITPIGVIGKKAAKLVLTSNGQLQVYMGANASGTQIETTIRNYLAQRLNTHTNNINMMLDNSETIHKGSLTGGSTTTAIAFSAIDNALADLIAEAKSAYAKINNIPSKKINATDGHLMHKNEKLKLIELTTKYPEIGSISATQESTDMTNTFPNGCYICEVEIDAETGLIQVVKITCVDDFGHIINAQHVEGQVHGGITQAIGQALYENTQYDDDGMLLTGSFMDYTLPRADHLCHIENDYAPTHTKTNPLGIKGAGEGPATGGPPAIVNAIIDAMGEYDVKHIDMPITPEKIWRIIQRTNKKSVKQQR